MSQVVEFTRGFRPRPDEYVIPGNIIVRQRGTVFHPGQHVRLSPFVSITPDNDDGYLPR